MRGATSRLLQRRQKLLTNFNPRSSCEERLHSNVLHPSHYVFQSTLLMRGATWAVAERVDNGEISIHAPHARSDGIRELQ